MEENVYSSSLGDEYTPVDDTVEMSGNFFSQLDSMIAAVKVESSALDSMKEKLREVEPASPACSLLLPLHPPCSPLHRPTNKLHTHSPVLYPLPPYLTTYPQHQPVNLSPISAPIYPCAPY